MTVPIQHLPEAQQIPAFTKIVDDIASGNNVFLAGPAGTGKTTLAEKAAWAIAGRKEGDGPLPFKTINCTQWTSPGELKGGQTMEGYREGGLIEAWRDGLLLILDEMPKLDPNTAGILNDALAKSGKADAVIFNGLNQPIPRHPGFGCIATGNTFGNSSSAQYGGNQVQDASLLDRFSGCLYEVGYNETLERMLVYPDIFSVCQQIRKALESYEGQQKGQDAESILSLRTMLNIQKSYELEMLRKTGIADHAGKRHEDVPHGKTLKDAIEAYLLPFPEEKARFVREQVNLQGFYNGYKGQEHLLAFVEQYQKRKR